jgi:hypothetical protein
VQSVGAAGLALFQALDLSLWRPTYIDLVNIQSFLQASAETPASQIAQHILHRMLCV